MIGVTTSIIHDTRIKKKDDTYAIKLRITFNRIQKYFPTGKYLSKDDWSLLKSGKHRNQKLKELQVFLNSIENKAVQIIDKMADFTFEDFVLQFNTKPKVSRSVIEALERRYNALKDNGRLGTATTYYYSIKSIKDYLKSMNRKQLRFSEVTPIWLEGYEKWMKENDRSITTVGIYLRNLRTVLNEAIEDGLLKRESYPFSKRKYQIPSANNIKKALTIAQIKSFIEAEPATDAECRAKDLWLFSYLCNGVNIKDMAKLKYQDMDKDHIYFVRSKTERSTKSNQKTITIVRIPEVDNIIEKWGTKPKVNNAYVFDILSVGDSIQEQYDKVKQAIKTINKYTKRIGERLGFEMNLTTYTARHSFATVLKRSGAPIEYISESLGHKDLKTTENYLDSFEDETREKYQRRLLDF